MDTKKGNLAAKMVVAMPDSEPRLKAEQLKFSMRPEEYLALPLIKRLQVAQRILVEQNSRLLIRLPAVDNPEIVFDGWLQVGYENGIAPSIKRERLKKAELLVWVSAENVVTGATSRGATRGDIILNDPDFSEPYVWIYDLGSLDRKRRKLSDKPNTASGEIVELIDSAVVAALERDLIVRHVLGQKAVTQLAESLAETQE
jgi:hypothetical protein